LNEKGEATRQDQDETKPGAYAYDKKKQAEARKHPPFYTTDSKFSRSQIVRFCNECGDTAFELEENGKLTSKCCRCGKSF